jgi:hypothetical protein
MNIKTPEQFNAALSNGPYAWPGGYPLAFVMSDGETICFVCATDNAELIRAATGNGDRSDQWRAVLCDVNWEDPHLHCSHCNARIESAYAEDNAKPERGHLWINRTYATTTPESAEHGEYADQGFTNQNESVSFRDLVDIARQAESVSCSPASGSICEWLSMASEENMTDGSETVESVHYSKDNPARKEKYWRKAFACAGLISSKQRRS